MCRVGVLRAATALIVTVLVAAGCTGADADPDGGAAPNSRPTASEPAPAPTPSAAQVGDAGPSPECRPGPGRTVEELPDVRTELVVVPEVRADDAEIGGTTVEGVVVPGVTIPGQIIDAGCIVRHEAPGGCLGAVEISGVTIPAVTIPERRIPETRLPDGTVLPAQTLPAQTREAVRRDGVRREQVCQQQTGRTRLSVTRLSATRISATRISTTQTSATRVGTCVSGGCIDGVTVDGVTVNGVTVDGVTVDGETLDGRTLPAAPDVTVLPGKDRTAWSAPGDVLFDTDEATIKPGAVPVLRAIAGQLREQPATAGVTVEGHTDDRGTDAHNLDLSRRRAQAVADWLGGEGGVARARMTVTGLGETAPAAPNTSPGGQQRNRRVVVTAG